MEERDLPEPFLGRLIVKVLRDEVASIKEARIKAEVLQSGKVSSEFLDTFDLALDAQTGRYEDTGAAFIERQTNKMPTDKGIVIKISPDCFKDAFQSKYGDVGYTPKVGDTVWFIPNGSTRIDPEDIYHTIGDNDIILYKKTKNYEEHVSEEEMSRLMDQGSSIGEYNPN